MSNGVNTDRVTAIIDSCRDEAFDQVTALQEMIAGANPRDIKAMATIALAAENTARTVQKMCFLSLQGGDHGLAGSAA